MRWPDSNLRLPGANLNLRLLNEPPEFVSCNTSLHDPNQLLNIGTRAMYLLTPTVPTSTTHIKVA